MEKTISNATIFITHEIRVDTIANFDFSGRVGIPEIGNEFDKQIGNLNAEISINSTTHRINDVRKAVKSYFIDRINHDSLTRSQAIHDFVVLRVPTCDGVVVKTT